MLGLLTILNTSFQKALNARIAEATKVLIKKKILWMFGSIQVLHTLLFAQGEDTSKFLLMYILKVQTNTEAGSNHHFLHLLQAETALHISKLLLTVGLLTVRAKRCLNLSVTVLTRKKSSASTVLIFFAFGLQVLITTQIFVSALKF